jgi:uncharacterized protein
MLHPFLQEKLPEITKMFRQYHVKSAYAFGSVVTDKFNDKSDVDLLVDFDQDMELLERGEAWWSLYYGLKDFLNRQVDLVTVTSLTNPYFIEELNETKQFIYGERS